MQDPVRARPLLNSLWLATLATAVAVAIGLAGAFLSVRRQVRGARTIERLLALPWAVPGTVFAIALATTFSVQAPWVGRVLLVGTLWILPLAYLVRNLPITSRAILAGFRALDPSLDEAAATLGAGRWRRLRRVTLPLLRPALLAGASLAFVTAFGDFVTSIMLYTYDTRPISLEILSSLRQSDVGVAAAYGVVLMLVSAAVFARGLGAPGPWRQPRVTQPLDSSRAKFRRLAVLIAVNFVDMIGFMIVLPLLPFYALDLHASPEIVGWLIASFSIAQLLAAPVWGRVSDRYGRRPALLIGLGASALAYVVFGFAESIWLLFLSRLVQGAGGGTTGVAQAYVADTIPPADRARALGWLSAATAAGVSLGPAVGSFAARLGQEAPGLVAAALCLAEHGVRLALAAGIEAAARGRDETASAGVAYRLARDSASRLRAGPAALDLRHRDARLLGDDLDPRAVSRGRVRAGCDHHRTDLHLHRHPLVRDAEPAARPDRGPARRALDDADGDPAPGGSASCSIRLPRSLWTLALVIPLVPIGTALLFPSTTSLMSRHSDPRELGATMGVAQTFAGLARVVAPLLATAAFQRLGHAWPFYLAGVCVAVVGVLAFQVTVEPAPQPVGVGSEGGTG